MHQRVHLRSHKIQDPLPHGVVVVPPVVIDGALRVCRFGANAFEE